MVGNSDGTMFKFRLIFLKDFAPAYAQAHLYTKFEAQETMNNEVVSPKQVKTILARIVDVWIMFVKVYVLDLLRKKRSLKRILLWILQCRLRDIDSLLDV